MGRVAIVGTPGAGKSTLARELGARAGLPVIHLDQHHFLPGWQRKSDEEWDRIAAELLADFSRARGYLGSVKLGSVKRLALAYLGRPAPDFAPGCEDKLDRDFWRLLKTIHRYPKVQRPGIVADLERRRREGKQVIVARNRREIDVALSGTRPSSSRKASSGSST